MSATEEFGFSCPHCGQRLATEGLLKGQRLTCPNCRRDLSAPATSVTTTEDGLEVPTHHEPGLHAGRFQKFIAALVLVLLGILSPVVILLAMAVTVVFGPVALVAAPAVALLITVLSCRYVCRRTSATGYWSFVVVGGVVPMMLHFWPRSSASMAGDLAEGGRLLEPGLAVAGVLHLAVTVLWFLGAAFTWWRARRS